jgi:hypothetical protein
MLCEPKRGRVEACHEAEVGTIVDNRAILAFSSLPRIALRESPTHRSPKRAYVHGHPYLDGFVARRGRATSARQVNLGKDGEDGEDGECTTGTPQSVFTGN